MKNMLYMKRRKLRHTRRDLAISPRHHISSTTRYDIICTPGPQHRTYGESRVLGQNDPFFKLNVENGLIFKLLFKMTSFMPHQPIKSIFYILFTLLFQPFPSSVQNGLFDATSAHKINILYPFYFTFSSHPRPLFSPVLLSPLCDFLWGIN